MQTGQRECIRRHNINKVLIGDVFDRRDGHLMQHLVTGHAQEWLGLNIKKIGNLNMSKLVRVDLLVQDG